MPLGTELLGEDDFLSSRTNREAIHDDGEAKRRPCTIEKQAPIRSGNDGKVHGMPDTRLGPGGNQAVGGLKADAKPTGRPEHLAERLQTPQIQGKAAEEEQRPDGEQDNPQPRLRLHRQGTPKQSAGPNKQDGGY